MLLTEPHSEFATLEAKRDLFIAQAEAIVPESLRELISKVERFAPPVECGVDQVTVTVEGSNYADPDRYPE